jgi:hypothetical protein
MIGSFYILIVSNWANQFELSHRGLVEQHIIDATTESFRELCVGMQFQEFWNHHRNLTGT